MSNESVVRKKISWRVEHRFLFLLISLFAAIAISPLADDFAFLGIFSDLFLTLVFLSGLWVASQQRGWLIAGVCLACPMLLSVWAAHLGLWLPLKVVGSLCGILFTLLLVIQILGFVFRARRVNLELIHAAVVCYLLIGLGWAFIYGLIESLYPGSFSVATLDMEGSSSALTYFSFITLTTLGYGDISPVAQVARSFAILEAIIGQIYLTVLVARLVGMHIAQETSPPKVP